MDWTEAGRAYLLDLMVRMAHHSTAIEGNTLTLGDTRSILINGIVPKATKLRELWEVLNYKDLVPYLTEHAEDTISLSMIQDVNGILLQYIDRRGGHFKEAENMIIGASFIPTPPSQVPQALTQWYDNLSYRLAHAASDAEKVEAIMDQHIHFERIHPFADGNGRTGRALMIHSCMQQGLAPIVIEKEQRDEYIVLMNREDTAGLMEMALALQQKESERMALFAKSTTDMDDSMFPGGRPEIFNKQKKIKED